MDIVELGRLLAAQMDEDLTSYLNIDLDRLVTARATPLRWKGWVLVAVGAMIFAILTLQFAESCPGHLDRLSLIVGTVVCVGLFALGVCELLGITSRRRWKKARRDVVQLSNPRTIRWRHDPGKLGYPLIVAVPALLMVIALPALSGAWALAIATTLVSMYFVFVVVFNTREIARRDSTITYSSGPLPNAFDSPVCAHETSFVFLLSSRGGTFSINCLADKDKWPSLEMARISTIELATTVAAAVQLMVLAELPIDKRQERLILFKALNERMLPPTKH